MWPRTHAIPPTLSAPILLYPARRKATLNSLNLLPRIC